MKYKIELSRDFDYIYGEFVVAILGLLGLFIYQLTQKSNIVPVIVFIGSSIILLIIFMILLTIILKRKYIYINTTDDIIEYRNYCGKIKSFKILENKNNLKYKIITDNSIQFIYQIILLNKNNKKIFKMWNSDMNMSQQNSKIILNLLIEESGFAPL